MDQNSKEFKKALALLRKLESKISDGNELGAIKILMDLLKKDV